MFREQKRSVAWAWILAWLLGGAAFAQPVPRFYLDRSVEVQGCAPREGDAAREERREAALLQRMQKTVGNLPHDLAPSLLLSPRKGEKLWVFYDSVCRGSVDARGFKAQKMSGKIPVSAWFHFEAPALPVTLNGSGRWTERAVYLEAVSSQPETVASANATVCVPVILPEYTSQQIFTQMLVGLKNPPPDWQIKRWMTESNYGQSVCDPVSGVQWLELKYKYPTKQTNQTVLCRAGDQLRVWNRLPHNQISQAFQWSGKTYLVLTQTGRGTTWTDLYRLDKGALVWITGHRLPEDPSLDEGAARFQFQENAKGYIGD